MERTAFITGGTGYIGRGLIPELLAKGWVTSALVRQQSVARLPNGCRAVVGDPLNAETFTSAVPVGCAFVQLVGVPHPSPAKARQFREIDLVSVRESVKAAVAARADHFIYLSVAQPAPMMKDYVAVRAEGEAMIRAAGIRATFVRPWYVLGPGHRWPCALIPFYWLCERIPATRAGALRLGLVTLRQLVRVVISAAEHPLKIGITVLEVPDIRASIRHPSR